MTRRYTARAAVTATSDAGGRTRLPLLRSDGPLALRETPGGDGATVHLVGAAAGPLGGDVFDLAVTVGPGARLALRSTASTLALPGDGRSRMVVRAEVSAGGHLDFAPEPTVAAAGCDHRAVAAVALRGDATLRWREELVLGRHREEPGRHTGRFDVTVDGVPLLRHELRLDDPAVYRGDAVIGRAKAVGSLLLVGPGLVREPWVGEGVGALPLEGPGVLITAVAADSAELRRRLASGERRARGPVPVG
ncbi:urease accessory protein UreD [Actinomadura kijaniata]|uniref:urease accessory protein UreD n=1 Tax=Actinomadura kijaniata TaxID=46161 RepID=UPI002FE91E5B